MGELAYPITMPPRCDNRLKYLLHSDAFDALAQLFRHERRQKLLQRGNQLVAACVDDAARANCLSGDDAEVEQDLAEEFLTRYQREIEELLAEGPAAAGTL